MAFKHHKLLKQACPTLEGIHACYTWTFFSKKDITVSLRITLASKLNLCRGIGVKGSRTQKKHLLQGIQDFRALQLPLNLQHAFFNTVASLKF